MSIEETGRPEFEILTFRFMSSGQWDRSLASALEWLGWEPENIQAHRVVAQSLVNLNRPSEARPHIARVLAGNPNDDCAHRLMSIVQFEQGEFQAADESIRKAIDLDPCDADHWHHLAYMCYQQGDLATAAKCAGKALEFNPRDANILNLLILCTPERPENAAQKIRRYQEALALDPENANVHNNLGTEYLDGAKDYPKAEECFRRALLFEPSSKLIRQNLFVTIKHRDWVYRTLCAPKHFLLTTIGWFDGVRKKSLILFLLLVPIWLLVLRLVLGGLLLWFMWVWPLTKVYEYLTIGDILASAGEPGARRGGLLGYRQWSLSLRLSLFAFCLVLFWGGFYYVVGDGKYADSNNGRMILGSIVLLVILISIGYWVRSKIRNSHKTHAARRRARQFSALLEPRKTRRKWWSLGGRIANHHE